MASSRPANMLCGSRSGSGSNTRKALGEITNCSTDPYHPPGPYVEGMVLDLPVNWTRRPPSKERVLFTVTKVFEVTQSPVMEVQWASSSGEAQTAILKLFDRRYGHKSRWWRETCHNPGIEACWQRYVQSGQAPGLFEYIKERDKEEGVWYIDPLEADLIPTADTWEMTAKKEGRLQYRLLQWLEKEVRAYQHLEKLQGKCVPLFYGTTSLSLAPPGPDSQFFRVGGILTQKIDGFTLDSLLKIEELWPGVDYQALVQRVGKVAEDVNACGVVNADCVPHNMIIQTGSMQPFEFDFSHCSSREDFASEDEYNEHVRYSSNSCGFGAVVAKRLNKSFKLGISFRYGPLHGNRTFTPDEL